MTKILIGVDGSDRSEDAVAFGRALALAADAPVVLSTAHPADPRQPRLDGRVADLGLREEAERMLGRLSLALVDVEDVELRPLAEHSAAKALHELAEETEAGIIVVGSSHVGRLGRVLPGSTRSGSSTERPVPWPSSPSGSGPAACPSTR